MERLLPCAEGFVSMLENLRENELSVFCQFGSGNIYFQCARLLNITIMGIEQSCYRLKKWLKLTGDDDLSRYLMMF